MAARIQSGVVVCLVLLISSFPHTTANAQTTNATLNGQVTDTSGAAVPNAKVVVVNDATNVRYETKTNNDGIYVEPNLPPGTYHIEITKEGFKTVMQPGIELHVEDARSANYTLQVGATSETVTVQARSYMINTQDAAVSTTIDRNFAENLPLNGRSFQTLILLTPGTVLTTADSANSNGGQFSVNGQRANANSFTVDGVSANVGGPTSIASTNGQLNGSNPGLTALGTTQGLIAVDALQEFKIQSSTYAPEFGRQPGGQISLLTRSGTNEFHGTAFDYLRNDIFDANNWFNDAANPPRAKGKERQNDFGGTIGGRIFQDKTFFFLSYEGLRLLQPVTFVDTVPSLRLRKESAPAYQAVLNSWPIPGGPESVDSSGNPTGSAPYTFSSSAPTNLDSYSVKIDHTIGSRLHLFGRYAKTTSASAPFTQSNETFANTLKLQTVTLGLDAARGANLSNEMRINYTLNKSSNVGALYLVGGATGFDESPLFPAPLVAGRDQIAFILSLPLSNFSLNLGSQGRNTQRQANLVDSVSYSRASHQIKSGIDYRRLFPTYDTVPLAAGYFPSSENDLQTSNLSFTLTQANVVGHPIFTSFSAYMQDTWRVSSRLTLTYGLRWELNFAPGERDGDYPPNVIGISNPATATIVPSAGPFKTTYGNFAPRVGLAFQARQLQGHETVVRGGLGVFYDLNTESYVNGFREGVFQNFSPVFTNVPFPVANNFFAIPPLPAPLTLPLSFAPLAIDPHLQLPYTLQWNASVEQGLGNNQSLLM